MFTMYARHIRLLCFLWWLLAIPAAHAAIDVLDRMDITHGVDESTIHIYLNIPVSYKLHVPEHSGDLLRIFVEPLPTPGSAADVLLGRESIQWSADSRVPLFDVTYEGQGFGNTTINLRFQKEVEFEIPKPADFRTLDVVIKHPKTGKPDITDTGPRIEAKSRPDADVSPRDKGLPETGETLSFPYVVNLASSIRPFSPENLPELEQFMTYRLYTTIIEKDGKTWNRLRLGFFKSSADATAVMNKLLDHYPHAWVAEASANERMQSGETMPVDTRHVAGATGAAKTDAGEIPAITKAKPPSQRDLSPQQAGAPAIPAERLGALMEDARQKMTAEDYSGAIRIYTKVSQSAENQYSQDALEFMGLARERKGQLAQAKRVYKQYLERYPDGEGADRVRQRLLALITVRKQPPDKLRTPQARTGKQTSEWAMFGGLSQFYRRDESTTGLDEDDEITTVSQSSADSNMDITGRLRGGDYDLRTRFTGGYLHDFLDNGVNSDTTVSSMYFDAQNRKHELSMRLGRQSRSSGGVLGRFDGLLLGFPLGKKFSVRAVGGYPVQSSKDSFESDRYFYGLTLEANGFAKGWDANIFAIEQRVEGITDRRAIGGELRYFDPSLSFFSLIDYDIHYNELNIGQFLGNWILPDKTTINLTLDYRNSPILTTRNALTGQGIDSLDDLQDNFSDSEIYDLARDRTATSKLATLGISRPINEKLQISGDVTVTNLSDTDESGGIEATVGTGTDYFYNLQLIGSNLITTGDITILGLRYADTEDQGITSLTFNMRYPFFNRDLRINPRFRFDYRKNRDDDTNQKIYRPSLRLTYQAKRKLRLEAEIGGEYSDREIVDGSTKDRSYFFSLGYRADF
jgi:tetratricopeptide (TPR) repeat protein